MKKIINFQYEKKYIDFFKLLIKPLSAKKQDKLLEKLLSHDGDIEYAIMKVLCDNQEKVMIADSHECDYDVALQMESMTKSLSLDGFEAEENTKKEHFIDWMDGQGYETFYWIVDMYDFRMITTKKDDRELLIKASNEADFMLLPLLPSHAYPSNFITIKKQNEDDLETILKEYGKRAEELGKSLFIYVSMKGCRPCAILQNSINEPIMEDAFKDVLILHLDIFDWMLAFKKLFLEVSTAPLFIYVTSKGKVTGHIVDGDVWGDEDKPEFMAKALKNYFADSEHFPLKITQNMKLDTISWFIIYGDTSSAIELIERYEADNYSLFLHKTVMGNGKNQREMADYLLQQGADIDTIDEFGSTPLMCAIHQENVQMIKHLLENGADVIIKELENNSPFMEFLKYLYHDDNFADLIELFLQQGAKKYELDKQGKSLLEQVNINREYIVEYDRVMKLLE